MLLRQRKIIKVATKRIARYRVSDESIDKSFLFFDIYLYITFLTIYNYLSQKCPVLSIYSPIIIFLHFCLTFSYLPIILFITKYITVISLWLHFAHMRTFVYSLCHVYCNKMCAYALYGIQSICNSFFPVPLIAVICSFCSVYNVYLNLLLVCKNVHDKAIYVNINIYFCLLFVKFNWNICIVKKKFLL